MDAGNFTEAEKVSIAIGTCGCHFFYFLFGVL